MAFHIHQREDGGTEFRDGEGKVVAFIINPDGSVTFPNGIESNGVIDTSGET